MYIVHNDRHIIEVTPRYYISSEGNQMEIDKKEILGRYPSGTMLHYTEVPLDIESAKSLYRVRESKVIRRPLVSMTVHPSVIVADGIDECTIHAIVSHALEDERLQSLWIKVGEERLQMTLDSDLKGSITFRTNKEGLHVFEVDWPGSTSTPKMVAAI